MNKNILFYTGLGLVILSLIAFVVLISPILFEELKYTFFRNKNYKSTDVSLNQNLSKITDNYISPVDNDFSIIIPKIGVNSKVIKNVDPFNSKEYQVALTKGVAHAKGSVTPEIAGNVFIFAHSSNNLLTAQIYNSVFYLASKLEDNDVFYIVYNKQIYKYKIVEKKVVSGEDISYIKGDPNKKTATLMTCYPAGTTFRRLVVIGEKQE